MDYRWSDHGDRLIRHRLRKPGIPASEEHFPLEDDWMHNRRQDIVNYLNAFETTQPDARGTLNGAGVAQLSDDDLMSFDKTLLVRLIRSLEGALVIRYPHGITKEAQNG